MDAIELIFINDASTDLTYEKLLSIEQQYPNDVLVINFEENRGQGAARNVGLTYASAPYVGFVDSDDWVEPDMFEKMIQALEKYDCDFVQCQYDFVGEDIDWNASKPWEREWCAHLSDENQRREFICQRMGRVALWDKVYKKSFLQDNDIFCMEGMRFEDILFSDLVFIYAQSSYGMNHTFYHYYHNKKGTMQQKSNPYQLEKMKVAEAFLEVCIDRGLILQRKDEVEWLFLKSYYIHMLWEVFHNFPDQSFSLYQQMKANVKSWVPDYKVNPYRKIKGNEFEDVMLKLLDYDMDEEQLERIRQDLISKIDIPV
jgi:glycosyltransferase involved in cell wall biosynthesis